jgi:hypothetical protein
MFMRKPFDRSTWGDAQPSEQLEQKNHTHAEPDDLPGNDLYCGRGVIAACLQLLRSSAKRSPAHPNRCFPPLPDCQFNAHPYCQRHAISNSASYAYANSGTNAQAAELASFGRLL